MMGFMQQISDWKCATQSLNENIEAAVGCEQNLIFSFSNLICGGNWSNSSRTQPELNSGGNRK